MRRRRRLFVLLLAVFLSGSAIAGPREDGLDAWLHDDYVTALRLLRPFADRGDATAQYFLGVMYSDGQGVPQDYAEAVRWYRKAADQGDKDAQFDLGLMYSNGRGVPQDYAEAVKWYRKAADQGNARAQFSLGVMYSNGRGVPQDYAEAVRWYRKAADQGEANAQNNLGVKYEFGQGVLQDYVQAHMFYNLAAAQASQGANRDKSVKNRDELAAKMTAAQLARAQELARNWRPTTGVAAVPSAPPVRPALPPQAGTAASREMVRTAQNLLAALGFDPGPADGAVGTKTRTAIRAFQTRVGMTVDGEVSEALLGRLSEATATARATPSQPKPLAAPAISSSGTGFIVSTAGHVLTNAHVVEGCRQVRLVRTGGDYLSATVAAASKRDDLALLKADFRPSAVASFRGGSAPVTGDTVVAFGFPLAGALASEGNVATGIVAALAGLGDDASQYQISVPVQPGNSGGPLVQGCSTLFQRCSNSTICEDVIER